MIERERNPKNTGRREHKARYQHTEDDELLKEKKKTNVVRGLSVGLLKGSTGGGRIVEGFV